MTSRQGETVQARIDVTKPMPMGGTRQPNPKTPRGRWRQTWLARIECAGTVLKRSRRRSGAEAQGQHRKSGPQPMRWALIPSWSREAKLNYATFNAKAETIDTAASFRDAGKAGHRCLVVADGFYEWRKSDKQPFVIAGASGKPRRVPRPAGNGTPKPRQPRVREARPYRRRGRLSGSHSSSCPRAVACRRLGARWQKLVCNATRKRLQCQAGKAAFQFPRPLPASALDEASLHSGRFASTRTSRRSLRSLKSIVCRVYDQIFEEGRWVRVEGLADSNK